MPTEQTLAWLHHAALACYGLSLAGALVRRPAVERWFSWLGLCCLALTVAGICLLAGRPPLYGPLETFSDTALVTALATLGGRNALPPGWAPAAVAGQLLLVLFFPIALNGDFYMYDHPLPLLFFQFRLAATGLLAAAALFYAASLGHQGDQERRGAALRGGRNLLLMGLTTFLCGEFCGSLWCLLWLGEYWRWTGNFLMSTLVFILTMPALHLPPRLAGSPRAKAACGALPGLALLALTLTQQALHA